MRKINKAFITFGFVFTLLITFAFKSMNNNDVQYKCMVQLTNYTGEGAYLVISLIDPEGNYEKTLYMYGDDEEWYEDFKEWWRAFSQKKENIDAITGESIIGGERKITAMKINASKVNAGYKLRFETAVEDQKYYVKDVEFPLSSNYLNKKIEGEGYIRYVRVISN